MFLRDTMIENQLTNLNMDSFTPLHLPSTRLVEHLQCFAPCTYSGINLFTRKSYSVPTKLSSFHFLETYYPASGNQRNLKENKWSCQWSKTAEYLGNRKYNIFQHTFKVKETLTINRINTEGHPLSGESWEDNVENKRGQSSPAMVENKIISRKIKFYLKWGHNWWSRALVSRESKGKRLKSAEKADLQKDYH